MTHTQDNNSYSGWFWYSTLCSALELKPYRLIQFRFMLRAPHLWWSNPSADDLCILRPDDWVNSKISLLWDTAINLNEFLHLITFLKLRIDQFFSRFYWKFKFNKILMIQSSIFLSITSSLFLLFLFPVFWKLYQHLDILIWCNGKVFHISKL